MRFQFALQSLLCMKANNNTHMTQVISSVSLAASPPLPGWSHACCEVACNGLASFALNHVSLECQLHVTCEPVEYLRVEDEFCILEGVQLTSLARVQPSRCSHLHERTCTACL